MRDILLPGLNPWESVKTLVEEVGEGYAAGKSLFRSSDSYDA
jgi:hypothetical protein